MHPLSKLSRLWLLAPLLSACVISPVDLDGVEDRYAYFTVSGYGSDPGQTILVRAWNYDRAAWELVSSTVTRASSIGNSPKLYAYEADGVRLGKRYWQPTTVPCTNPGTARLKVYRVTPSGQQALVTFTQEGMECLGEELAAGTEPAGAGNVCNTGEEVRMVAPPQCAPDNAPVVSSGTHINFLVTDDVDVIATSRGWVNATVSLSRPVRVSADVRAYHGLRSVRMYGTVTVTCRRPDGTRREVTSAHETRATPPSGSLDQSLGTSMTFDLPVLRGRCGAEPLISIDGAFDVEATHLSGATSSNILASGFKAR